MKIEVVIRIDGKEYLIAQNLHTIDYLGPEEDIYDVSLLKQDDEIQFDYKKDGSSVIERRYLIVDHVDDRHVYGVLNYPEEHEGEFRRFRIDCFQDME